MLYSLPTGKVIELSVEQYLDLTDEELEYLISINYGEAVENPLNPLNFHYTAFLFLFFFGYEN